MAKTNTKPWWARIGLTAGMGLLAWLFRPDYAREIYRSRRTRRFNNRATRKGHIHTRRPTGSKMLKKYDRAAWDLWVKERAGG